MKLSEILAPDRVLAGLSPQPKNELLERLAVVLAAGVPGFDAEEIRRRLIEREGQMSTGLERGIALPHAMLPECEATYGVCAICPPGLDFESLDGEPARFVTMLVFRDDAVGRSRHLELLAAALRIFSDETAREALLAATSPGEVLETLVRTEVRLGL